MHSLNVFKIPYKGGETTSPPHFFSARFIYLSENNHSPLSPAIPEPAYIPEQ